jgi:TatD DNase family protein
VPGDRLLVETDSPFLSPPGAPRGRNTPEWVRTTAAWVAEIRGEAREIVGERLVATYEACFGSSVGAESAAAVDTSRGRPVGY